MAYTYPAKNNAQPWLTGVAMVLGFWLSATILIDFTIMPSLYISGMMNSPNFGAVGYTLFSVFNRIELVCGAAALSMGLWLWRSDSLNSKQKIEIGVSSAILLLIAICYTFILTPQMSGLSINLNMMDGLDTANGGLENLQMHSTINDAPPGMNQMHVVYWVLETLKITLMATGLGAAYRRLTLID
jgi:UDP-N-acetylmuramyl pentapeptide phosphotransferase/UDP-N-acetylglucosamine-1-phosphate transferase